MKIAIADDEIIYRRLLSKKLSAIGFNNIIFEADNGQDLLKKLEQQIPHIIFIDVVMPKIDGIHAAQIISESYPDLIMICFSHYKMESHIEKIKACGFKGYLLKEADEKQLQAAIYTALEGSFYLDNTLNKNTIGQTSTITEYTKKDIQLIQLLFEGLDVVEIADKLNRAPSVIYKQKNRLLKRYNIKNEIELIKKALKEGIVSLEN